MTDEYETVAFGDLQDGDEAEIVFRGEFRRDYINTGGWAGFGKSFEAVAHTIKRKVKPKFAPGDTVSWSKGKLTAKLVCINKGAAWLEDDRGQHYSILVQDLIQPLKDQSQ